MIPRTCENVNHSETRNIPHCPVRNVSYSQNGWPQIPAMNPHRKKVFDAKAVIDEHENMSMAA
jgi:hypothetical protein